MNTGLSTSFTHVSNVYAHAESGGWYFELAASTVVADYTFALGGFAQHNTGESALISGTTAGTEYKM